MKRTLFPALVGSLLALSWTKPADAWTLEVFNKSDKAVVVTVTYYTHLCKDDRGVEIAPHGKFSVNAHLCKVKTVYASMKTMPGLALVCIPRNGTGASTYVVTANQDLKTCHVD